MNHNKSNTDIKGNHFYWKQTNYKSFFFEFTLKGI
jgi:hypothetical protein